MLINEHHLSSHLTASKRPNNSKMPKPSTSLDPWPWYLITRTAHTQSTVRSVHPFTTGHTNASLHTGVTYVVTRTTQHLTTQMTVDQSASTAMENTHQQAEIAAYIAKGHKHHHANQGKRSHKLQTMKP